MNHETAMKLQATERYILGELSPEERDEFEEHFFDCPECAKDVMAAEVFAANARAVFRDEDRKKPWIVRQPAFAVCVGLNAVLLAVLGIQVLKVEPELRKQVRQAATPQFYSSFFVPGVSKGEEKTVTISRKDPIAGMSFHLEDSRYPSYEYEILNQAGSRELAGNLAAPPEADLEVNLAIPISSLKPGRYQFVLRGSNGKETTAIRSCRLEIR